MPPIVAPPCRFRGSTFVASGGILRVRMPQESIDLLHQTFDAFNRRDLDAFLALCDPEVEFISYLMQVAGGQPYRGHA